MEKGTIIMSLSLRPNARYALSWCSYAIFITLHLIICYMQICISVRTKGPGQSKQVQTEQCLCQSDML